MEILKKKKEKKKTGLDKSLAVEARSWGGAYGWPSGSPSRKMGGR